MRYERSESERLSDQAVLLSLYAGSQRQIGYESLGDRIKLMKLAFFATYELYLQRVKALNLNFFRWHHGPMSREVSFSWEELSSCGMMVEDELWLVTEEGIRFADSFTSEVLRLEENRSILSVIEEVVDIYGALDTDEIKNRVYGMYCYTLDSPLHKHSVKSTALSKEFTRRLEEDEADTHLYLPPGWQITLELAFNRNAGSDLRLGIEDANAGRLYGWDALGTDV